MKLPATKLLNLFHWTLLVAFGGTAALEIFLSQPSPNLEAIIILLAATASITTLARQLPLQSVLFAALITALIGGAAHTLSAQWDIAIPFGPVGFTPAAGPQLFGPVPWLVPLLWVIAIFNSRGVARLVLRPWRKVKNYGYRLLGLSAALAVAFDFALEPFATGAKHLWRWQPTKIPFTWYGASPMNFLGWAAVALLILAFILPYLIRKQPGKSSPPDFAPLILWLGAVVVFAAGAVATGVWLAVVVDVALAGTVAVFAWRGVKW